MDCLGAARRRVCARVQRLGRSRRTPWAAGARFACLRGGRRRQAGLDAARRRLARGVHHRADQPHLGRTARARARESAMPLLVDFGADWCSACRELDHMALSDARVVSEARRFVVVRVDLSDASDEVAQGHLRGYDQSGLPFVVLHHSDGSESQRVTAPMEAEAFLELMRAVR